MVEGLLQRGYKVNVFDIKVTYEEDRVTFFTGDLCNKQVRCATCRDDQHHHDALCRTCCLHWLVLVLYSSLCMSPPAALSNRSLYLVE